MPLTIPTEQPLHEPAFVAKYGFTLIELLLVVAIMGMLMTLVVPAVNSISGSSQLTQAAQMVGSELDLARQRALSRNRRVEVRFYQYGDPEVPGESSAVPTSGRYRAIQSFEYPTGSSTAVPFDKLRPIPQGIVMDSGSTYSTLLNMASPRNPQSGTTLKPSQPLPRVANNYLYSSFSFLPNGSTDLLLTGQPASQWFVTLHAARYKDGLAAPPPNFDTIQVDAVNGNIRLFRP